MNPKFKRTNFKGHLITHRIHSYFPFPVKTPAVIGIIASVNAIAYGVYWPVIAIPVCLIVIVSSFAVQFDVKHRKYRFGIRFFGRQFVSWMSLDRVNYISIFPNTEVYHATARRVIIRNRYVTLTEMRVNFILNNRKRERLFASNRTAESQAFGMMLGEKLNLGVYDCTTPNHHWVYKAKH
jgi:hypothetical protein